MRPARSCLRATCAVLGALLASAGAASAQEDLRRTPVVRAVETASPAVVNISCEEMVRQRVFSGEDAEGFFHDFFEPRYKSGLETTSLGSGVLIDPKGYVLTNFHVVQRGARIKVALMDRREFKAKVLGTDPDLDLAVLKIDADGPLPAVALGDSSTLLPGEPVIAIGNPFGLSQTVTTGIVSATHRTINAGEVTFYDFVQTDAAINPGNSGGALLNIMGELIGINTAIYGRAQGIGFAIPINRAGRIAQDFIRHGEVRPAYVGMDLGVLADDQANAAGVAKKAGVLVVGLEAGGPADKSGIRKGDIILTVENYPVMNPQDYMAKMRDYTAGSVVRLEVARGKERIPLQLTAGEVPLELADRILKAQVGLEVDALDSAASRKLTRAVGKGVVITAVDARQQAGRARLQAGDVIRRVDAQDIEDLNGLRRAVIKARRKGTVEMLVERGKSRDVVAFKL
jgi:serine protease Do